MTINNPFPEEKVINPEGIADIFLEILKTEQAQDQEKEHFWIIGLKTNNIVKFIELVSLGTLNASLVHPREILRPCIVNNVASFIMCHNHPSGETKPSDEDKQITMRLKQCAELFEIPLLDHVIIAQPSAHFSFKTEGIL